MRYDSPLFLYTMFVIIFFIIMTVYGRKIESSTTPLLRLVFVGTIWYVIQLVSNKYNNIFAWTLVIPIMIIFTKQLIDRINYTSNPDVQETEATIQNYFNKVKFD